MAANGTLTPPSLPPAPTSPSLAKRKHVATNSVGLNGASEPAQGKSANGSIYTLQMVIEDILTVLKGYDTRPSVLTHPITSAITRTSSGEADSKRAKLTPPAGSATIISLIQEGQYDSLHTLEKDVENATEEILASSGGGDVSTGSGSLEDTTLQASVLVFRKVMKNLVDREEARKAHNQRQVSNPSTDDQILKEDGTPVPIKEEEDTQAPQSRTVLTLLGTVGTVPKQLFSSLQQSRRVAPTGTPSTFDTSVQVTLPLRESALPNVISTTEVFPLPDPDTKTKRQSTIGQVFRAPAHLQQISPPNAARPTTAKSNTITFAPPEVPRHSRKGSQTSYTNQNLSAGFWLGYAGVDMPKDQASPTAKQKSRQRALSMGESQQPPSEATLVAVQQAKEDALFRSAYSSFAPTRDDASAVIPEETKNRVWWQKVGEKRFSDMFPIDPALLDAEEVVEVEVNGVSVDEDEFRDAVENFVPIEEGGILPVADERNQQDKDTDEVLKEISELLETLASYQRIRNSSLTTNPRTPVVQNSSLASLAGSPSTPSTEEFDVYQILKSQLTLLISQLPPFAVAKLNGDQLQELNISRTILFDTTEYKGVLEEDALSKLAKIPAVPVSAPATLARTGSGTHAHYPASSNQYTRPTSSVHQSGARPVQAAQSFYPHQQSLHRSSSLLAQRSPSGPTHAYQTGGASYAPTSRSYSNTQSYSQQTPKPSYGQTPSGQYYPQRSVQPSSFGGAAASQYHATTPTSQTQNRYASQSNQNGYYPRSQNVAPMYGAAQTPQARTASPLKATPAPIMSYNARSTYATPVASGQVRPSLGSAYYGPSQYGTNTPQASAVSGFNGLPSNPQQMIIDRQQAQVAAQSQARLQAQNSFSSSRQDSGTPQPPNGSYGGQVNGTSMSA